MNRSRLAGGLAVGVVSCLVLAAPAFAVGPQPGALELPGKRTASSNSYLNTDGSYTAVVAPQAVNYRDNAGTWEHIDTTLVPSQEAGYSVENAAGPFRALFKGNETDDLVRFEAGGAAYTLGLRGGTGHAARTHGSAIDYPGAVVGADLGYRVLGTGIKETITLADAHGPSTFRFVLAGAGSLDAVSRSDGSIAFAEPGAAKPVFVLSSPWAADTVDGRVVHAGETHPQLTAHATGGGRYDVTVSVDRHWLESPDRRFPVVVDPTITITAAQDAEFETSCTYTPCQTRDDDPMSIGGDDVSTYAVGVQFDLTSLPAGASISDAELGLHFNGQCGWTNAYGFDCPPTAHTIDALRMTSPWSEGSVTTQTAPDELRYDPTVLAHATLAAGAAAGWLNWDLTPTVQAWVDGTRPNDGLLLKHDPEALDTGAPTFESSEDYDPTRMPTLDITYSGGAVPPPPPSYAQTIAADGPAGYWKLGDLGTTTAADSSGLGHPGDYTGSFTLGQTGLLAHPADTAVLFRNAPFDGRMTTQYLYGYAGSAVTAETWVNNAGATGNDQLVSRGYPSNGGWSLTLTRTNGLRQAQFTVVRGGIKYSATAPVTPGTLYLAGSYDGTSIRLYANGTLAATRTLSAAPLTATASTMLGGVLADDVTLDEAAVYDHALGAAQIAAHYNTGQK